MNARQRAFCEAYARTGNGAEAAREAGYSAATARTQAARLLTNDNIKKYLVELQNEQQSDRIASAAEIKEMLTKMLRNEQEKPSIRLKVANTLLRAEGALHPAGRTECQAEDATAVDDGENVQIILPWVLGSAQSFNAIMEPDGSLTPIPPPDDDMIIYVNRQTLDRMQELFEAGEDTEE